MIATLERDLRKTIVTEKSDQCLAQLVEALDRYQLSAAQTDQNQQSGISGLAFPLLGLFGEIGTLVSALKKKQRDKDSYVGYLESVVEEFGDVLWYLSNVALRASLSFADLARHLGFNSTVFKLLPHGRGSLDSPEFEAAVIALAGKAGLLLNDFSEGNLAKRTDALHAHLAEIFCALIQAAAVADVDLQQAARNNLCKINSRWPTSREYTHLFDESFEQREQLPRKIEMHIVETQVGGKRCVIQLCNGVEIGSHLTDNKVVEDDYRFHDVFHLANAAILGWSPCLRALLRVKRKSRAQIDESEDGARAILIEEGLSTLVFHHALRLNYFASIKSLDYSLLKTVQDFVAGYEVHQCPLWQWENAILRGFEVFRQLRTHRRGVVTADLIQRSITFAPLSNDR